MINAGELWKTSADEPLGANLPGEPRGPFPTTRPETDPQLGGTRWLVATYQPNDPSRRGTLVNRQGFHRTATIDYVYVLSGEIVLLTDEQEVTLKAGDFVVQRNNYHAWRNDGNVPARLLVTLVRVGT
jgi:hypothetical protein